MVSAIDIKNARNSLGESQAVFGARFGVDQSTIHRWETDAPPTRGAGRMALEKLMDELAKRPQTEAAE